ncbi:MAG: aminotransferase class V-fold PLP-dependent enzyme [Solirubrobacteraceae bacterium]|nr:aminotransferase class V-fold PLP-dependent enzyme [Solirubrobacteraceae bacterium]
MSTTFAAESTVDAARRPLLDVLGADLHVPLLSGESVRYVNLDYAATAPALRTVADRVAEVLPIAGSVHRGAGLPSQAASALYESARAAIGRAVGARADDHVVIVRNTTDATNLLARALPADTGDVVTLDVEHHANALPWRIAGHRWVEHAPTVEQTVSRLDEALTARPTALLAITGASNVTGELLPLRRIVALAHARGARVLVDAAQLAPHRRIDLAALDADYLALSGHKLYAPYGAGALVGRADWLDVAAPYLAGGGAVLDVRTDGTAWATGPRRHEAGTPNLAGTVALAAALEALARLEDPVTGVDRRAEHEEALRRRVEVGLDAIPGVRRVSVWSDAPGAIGVVAFAVDGYAPGHVGAYLSAEHGIGVRDGRFCAHPLLARLGLDGGALRASFGVGSCAEDADRLVAAIEGLVAHGPAHDYACGPDGWAPVHETRDLARWIADA